MLSQLHGYNYKSAAFINSKLEFADKLFNCSCVKLQFVIKMIDKKSLDFIFVAPKLKINKMVRAA